MKVSFLFLVILNNKVKNSNFDYNINYSKFLVKIIISIKNFYMRKVYFLYPFVLLGSYFLSSRFFPVKELSEKDKKQLPPIEDDQKDLEPKPPGGLFIRSGGWKEIKNSPEAREIIKQELLNKATRVKSVKISFLILAATVILQSYQGSLLRALSQNIAVAVYNSTNSGLYDTLMNNQTVSTKASDILQLLLFGKKKEIPVSVKTPFDIKLDYKAHTKIIRRYIKKLVKMEVPGETIRWICCIIAMLIWLYSSNIIPFTMGISTLIDAVNNSKALDDAAKKVIIELFYEMIEEEDKSLNS
jgi:hypothetical protein